MIDPHRLTFDPHEHRYTLDGNDVPSVTAVLSAEGLSGDGNGFWKEEHRKRGTAVHQIALLISKRQITGNTAEEIINNSLWSPEGTRPASLIPYGYALAEYLHASGFRPEIAETSVCSAKLGIAGTLDAWGKLPDGSTLLVDYKSGNPTAAADIQSALYCALLEEALGIKSDHRVIVWLNPDGTYKAFPPRPPGGADLAIGVAAISLYHWRKRHSML